MSSCWPFAVSESLTQPVAVVYCCTLVVFGELPLLRVELQKRRSSCLASFACPAVKNDASEYQEVNVIEEGVPDCVGSSFG